MTPKQYAAIIESLGLSQVGAARFLGVDERTSRRWIAGEREIPETVSRFLTFIAAAKLTPEEVEKVIRRYRA